MTGRNRVTWVLGVSTLGVLALVAALSGVAFAAAPQVTAVTFTSGGVGVTVTTGYYVLAPNASWGTTGTTALYVLPNASSADTTTASPPVLGGITYYNGASAMFGLNDNWGMMLIQYASASDLISMGSNLPTNANTQMLGGATGPVNKDRLSLNSAIPSDTTVTVTLNMQGEIPHLVGVMGGTYPTVTYDSSLNGGNGGMTIQTTTFSTTTNASDALTGILGFFITSDTSLGTTPLLVLGHTNAWVGDVFPFGPSFDTSAATGSGAAGSLASSTARYGVTIYGPTGQSRDVNIFVPNASLAALYGPTATTADLDSLVNGGVQAGDTITAGTNCSVAGTRFQFTYTFASPKDASVGFPSGSASSLASSSTGGLCFLRASRGMPGMGWPEIALLGALGSVLAVLAWRRLARTR